MAENNQQLRLNGYPISQEEMDFILGRNGEKFLIDQTCDQCNHPLMIGCEEHSNIIWENMKNYNKQFTLKSEKMIHITEDPEFRKNV